MAVADVNRLFAYWTRRPPPGDLMSILAQFIGWKPSPLAAATVAPERPATVEELKARFPHGVWKG